MLETLAALTQSLEVASFLANQALPGIAPLLAEALDVSMQAEDRAVPADVREAIERGLAALRGDAR